MKAIQFSTFGGPEVLELVEVERPSPGPGQVLIKVAASGVNFGDVNVRRGDLPPPPFPAGPGLEYSGTVEAVGGGVSHVGTGDRVVVQAYIDVFDLDHAGRGYAEYAVADAHPVVPLPDDIDFDAAAATFGNYLAAEFMLHLQARVRAGETLLLYGAAGGIGTATIELAKLAGVRVIGLVSSDERAGYVLERGAKAAINYRTEDVAQRVTEITGGTGVDFIFNSAGGDTLARDYDLLAPLGQIIWFGFAAGPPTSDLTALITRFENFAQGKGIRSSALPSYNSRPGAWQAATKKIIDLLRDGKIRPCIHEKLPLADAARAHALLEGSSVLGKLILKP